MSATLRKIRRDLRAAIKPGQQEGLQRFFKTGKGEYGEGDRFIGVTVPDVRAIAKKYAELGSAEHNALLSSPIHEERLLALILWTLRFPKADAKTQQTIFKRYLTAIRRGFINNWDLVDVSTPRIVGAYLISRDREDWSLPVKWAKSKNLWEKRMGVLAAGSWIPHGCNEPIFEVSKLLLSDSHDLIHKACGWMLREAGKREIEGLREFLSRHAGGMPRTMLRYSIEKMSQSERKKWLNSSRYD